MAAYYNEIDPYAAQWLRNLIAAGHIAPGDVDERSIVDVRPDDLGGYQQAHFFAGIGGWSYALRLAGWPDERPVWTGSCPCQPFSAAGAGKAADDRRHLWPAWFSLIAERSPAIVFGEQVEAAIGWGWLDLVFADLEGKGYACGASILPACGVGAPHIRQRLWFVADANGGNASVEGLQRGGEQRQQPQDGRARLMGDTNEPRSQGRRIGWDSADKRTARPSSMAGELADTLPTGRPEGRPVARNGSATGSGGLGDLAHTDSSRRREGRPSEASDGRDTPRLEPTGFCDARRLVNAASEQEGLSRRTRQSRSAVGDADSEREAAARGFSGRPFTERERSPWAEADWIECRDGKRRPVEPGTFPLAHGIPNRVGRLRAYGNAIVAQVAAEFIGAASEAIG